MGSNEIVTKQCSAVLKAAHSAANGTEKGLNFNLLKKRTLILVNTSFSLTGPSSAAAEID